jgi:hypothetical protein
MLYANKPKVETPTPFCEIRVFIYLRDKPQTPLADRTIRNILFDEVRKLVLKRGLAKTIGASEALNLISWEDRNYTKCESITIDRQPNKRTKIVIEGFEKEPVDIMEAIVNIDGMLQKHRTLFTEKWNKQKIPKNIMQDREKLLNFLTGYLLFGYSYRYVAFFAEDPQGKPYIKGEYDEIDIRQGALD